MFWDTKEKKGLLVRLCFTSFINFLLQKQLLEVEAYDFILKKTLVEVFSCEFCEISKNTFFTEHLWTTASASSGGGRMPALSLEYKIDQTDITD